MGLLSSDKIGTKIWDSKLPLWHILPIKVRKMS